jgi:hypothetical protein
MREIFVGQPLKVSPCVLQVQGTDKQAPFHMHRWPDDPKQRGFDELRELLVAERARLHSFDVRVVVAQVLTARSSHTTSNEQVITAGMEIARTEGELMSQRRNMITEKLFSRSGTLIWVICCLRDILDIGRCCRTMRKIISKRLSWPADCSASPMMIYSLLSVKESGRTIRNFARCSASSLASGFRYGISALRIRMRAVRSSPSSHCRWLRSRIRIVLW